MYIIGSLCIVWGLGLCAAALVLQVERVKSPPTPEDMWKYRKPGRDEFG